MSRAIRVYNGLFGPDLTLAALRMGDLVAVCNLLEFIRESTKEYDLKMYIPDNVVFPQEHCLQFRNWLIKNTDYVTWCDNDLVELQIPPGTDQTYPNMINLWNIRQDVLRQKQNVIHIPDVVKLPNVMTVKRKIVICPLTDAPYNAYRNWPLKLTQHIVTQWHCNMNTMELFICCKEPIPGLDIGYGQYSHDFEENLKHIQECWTFIGGETGTTKFASALFHSPPEQLYYYSQETYGTTLPFGWKKLKPKQIQYY
jgi:hypothetical protein